MTCSGLQSTRHRRLDGGDRGAQVMGHGTEQRGAKAIGLRHALGCQRLRFQGAAFDQPPDVAGEGMEHGTIIDGETATAQPEEGDFADGYQVCGVGWPAHRGTPRPGEHHPEARRQRIAQSMPMTQREQPRAR